MGIFTFCIFTALGYHLLKVLSSLADIFVSTILG